MTEQHWERGQLGGFWLRVVAVLVDVVVALAAFVMLVLLVPPVVETVRWDPPVEVLGGLVLGLLVLGALLYDVLMTAGIGGTLGKRAAGIEVRGTNGHRIEVGRALGRSLARLLSIVPVALGLLWVGWDRRKQGWHDKLAKTVVVKRRHLPVMLRHPDAPVWAAEQRALPAGSPAEPSPAEPSPAESTPAPAPQPQPAAASATTTPETGWSTRGPVAAPQANAPGEADAREEGPAEPASALDGEPAGSEPDTAPADDAGGDQEGLAAASGLFDDAPPHSALDTAAMDETDEPAGASQTAGASDAGAEREPSGPDASAFRELFADQPASQPGQTAGSDQDADEPEEELANGSDPNLVAIERAGVADDAAGWLEQVADQVDPRLDQVSATWRQQEQAPAARACAFGLLLGHLATLYPHMSAELDAVAEAHPSFSTLLSGSRLATLQQIAGDRSRMAAWLGPLIGVNEDDRVARLLQ